MVASMGNENWPTWRGPGSNGVAPDSNPPVSWSEEQNIRWKTPIPGEGHSSPIVWGDRIFLMTAVTQSDSPSSESSASAIEPISPPPRRGPGGPPDRGEGRPGRPPGGGPGRGPGGLSEAAPDLPMAFQTLCISRRDGSILWAKTGQESMPVEGRHRTNTYSSGSPVTDGEVVISNFSSYGIFCYDMDGKTLWSKDLGDMRTRNGFGEGSSPALFQDQLFVLWDTEEDSWLYALDKNSGRELWKVSRDEKTGWSTPFVITYNGVTQVIVNATNKVRSYDVRDGSLIWECGGQTTNAIPSIVSDGSSVYVMSGYRGNSAMAIALGGSGDITGSDKVRWTINRGTPYVPSPLLYDGKLYFCKGNDAFLSCVDAASGKVYYGEERLPEISGVYSSPVAAAGHIYLAGQNGATVVLTASQDLNVKHINKLDEPINASPAIIGNEILIRGSRHLYCITE
jgi:outer membrane protein assembly factor BamB